MKDETGMCREARVVYSGQPCKLRVTTPADVARFIRGRIGWSAREHFYSIWIDARNRPLAWDLVSIGTTTASLVHPAQIFQGPLMAGAHRIIIAHNHPSGDCKPSAEDREVTQRLAEVGKLLGVALLDHVIVGSDSEYSMREGGDLAD